MRFYLLSPKCPQNPHLFPLWVNEWERNGIIINKEIYYADVLLVDLHTRIFDYDERELEWLLNSRVPIITFDEYDKGGLSNLDWPHPLTYQQKQIFDHIERHNIKSVHFCRLLNKSNKYPPNLFPYEKPILYQTKQLSSEDLFNRQYDVVGIMNTAPQREAIKKALEEDGRLKCNIILGADKIPLQDWINEHKRGKFFISASGGGYSSEKPQHLFSVAAMLQENTDQLLLHEPIHLMNCIKISSPPTKADIDNIVDIVNNKEALYQIYEINYNFMTAFYSAEYIANFILQKILQHVN